METIRGFGVWVILGIALAIFGFFVFQPVEGIENVDATRTVELADSGVRIVDVRTATEFEAGHIPGAESVPIEDFGAVAGAWSRFEPVLIYCATGARSTTAVQWLSEQGFETVYHFNAGLVAWTGSLQSGPAVAMPPASSPQGSKVAYEFFTDW